MAKEVLIALIAGIVALTGSLLTFIIGWRTLNQNRRRQEQELRRLNAETEKLVLENVALRKAPLEKEVAFFSEIKESFLVPFQNLLEYNRDIYHGLLGERGALEYHPMALASFFSALPDNDKRKMSWYGRIKLLRQNNRKLLGLIQQFGGRIVTEKFRENCAIFRYHVDEWENVWTHIEHSLKLQGNKLELIGPEIPGDEVRGHKETIYAERFPADLWTTLEQETNEIDQLLSDAKEGLSTAST